MSNEFLAAVRRATTATRAGNLGEATRLIQQAITGQPAPAAKTEGTTVSPPRHRSRLHPDAEDAEIVDAPGSNPADGKRRPLSAVVRSLRESGRANGPVQPLPGEPVIPDGAAFLVRTYSCAAGSRGYRLYVPASAKDGVLGLVVMLHGCGQTPEDFATGTRMNAVAESHRLLVAYPAQTAPHNPNGCWNWFRPEDQHRGAGEPAIIAGLTRAVAAEFGVAPDEVFIAGLSAGGAMAAVMAESYPELYAAVGVHSGVAVGSARDAHTAFAAMRGGPVAQTTAGKPSAGTRMIVFHGTADPTVHPSNALRLAERAASGAASGRPERREGSRRAATRSVTVLPGSGAVELWMIDGAGHAWSGGNHTGTFTDAAGPDASSEMVRFFLEGRKR